METELRRGPMYEQEPCRDCGGDGALPYGEDCYTCAATGLVYTDAAIRLQVEAEEAHGRLHQFESGSATPA